jgi:co-chaperonin GroES (HSP10)
MSDIAVLETRKLAEDKATVIPTPTGYRILCVVPKVGGTFGDSTLFKSEETIRVEEQTTNVLFVVKMGPEAYADKVRFPNGPWCKEGDFIICRAYSGTRFSIHGTEWRIINDDTVEAVVDDPRAIKRV